MTSKYVVGSRIGSGTYGVVHRGYERTTDALVALKLIALEDESGRESRGMRETQCMNP